MPVQSRSLTFPPEVWSRVFSNCEANLDGLTHLWTDCRHVARAFMSEVEALFRSRYLLKLRVNFDLGVYYHGGYENGEKVMLDVSFVFDRLASDGNTAIFRNTECHEDFMPVMSKRLLSYIKSPAINRPKHMVELKCHVNDTELPELAYDPETRDLTFNWRQALTCFFYERRMENAYVHLNLLTPGSSGLAETERLKTDINEGHISMEKGLESLLNLYGRIRDEGHLIARRKRIFRQWKTLGWTERNVLDDENFEVDEKAALSALKNSAQFLGLLDSSDNEHEEEKTEDQHEHKNESEEEWHSDTDDDGSIDDEDEVKEQDDRSGEIVDD